MFDLSGADTLPLPPLVPPDTVQQKGPFRGPFSFPFKLKSFLNKSYGLLVRVLHGSIPSRKSLAADQYYAHLQNGFWYIFEIIL